ncbi:MAG TPA: Lrp/AsnC family transcriptional regulator [Candidatus Thermoplasmatota archaeon]|nr:Lrp/AsnC family transcriptional regulator [Candidatus Thermoplasmatota archaeon]
MDALDFGIVAGLARSPRTTYGELGSRVGLSANAVKARVHRMQSEGVLQGFAALPRPALLGCREGLLLFTGADDADEREEEILRGLAEVPGVRFIDISLDHSVWVWLLYRDEDDWERIERAAISLVGKPPARGVRGDGRPAPTRALAPSDWKVLRALQPDGRAHAKDLAARAGLTFKPLKRRLDTLLASGDVRVVPVVSPADASGSVLFRVVAFLHPDAPPLEVEGGIVTAEAPGVVSVLAQRQTLREARALQRDIAARPGIERAHLQVATRRMALGWLDDALARAATATAPAPATARVPLPKAR